MTAAGQGLETYSTACQYFSPSIPKILGKLQKQFPKLFLPQ